MIKKARVSYHLSANYIYSTYDRKCLCCNRQHLQYMNIIENRYGTLTQNMDVIDDGQACSCCKPHQLPIDFTFDSVKMPNHFTKNMVEDIFYRLIQENLLAYYDSNNDSDNDSNNDSDNHIT